MSSEDYFELLLPETREVLDSPIEEKINYIKAKKFIPYARAVEILRLLDEMICDPRDTRTPCVVLYGDSHNGKSSIIDEFGRNHPPTDGWDCAALPLITVECPAGPDVPALFDAILDRIMIPFKRSHTLAQKRQLIDRHLSQLGTKMLIIDEISNILMGTSNKRGFFMNTLKGLNNTLKLNIVGVGVISALRAVNTDDQMQVRFRPLNLPRWRLDEEYASLLASLELTLPFRSRPGLTDPDVGMKIFDMSNGVLGYIVEHVRQSAINALRKKRGKVTIDDVKEVKIPMPEQRVIKG